MKIAWVVPSTDLHSGCAWYRCIEPARLAVELGHECYLGDKLWLGERGPVLLFDDGVPIEPDVIVMRPLGELPELGEILARARAESQFLVLTMDDDPWEWHEEIVTDDYDRMMAGVDEVWCSTRPLMASLAKRFPDVKFVLVPNCYDPRRYERVEWQRCPRVGWHAMVDIREPADVELLAEEWPAGPRSWNGWRGLYHLGRGELPAGVVIEARPPVPIEELPAALDWEIGLVVMADTPFNACKTETKGFELGARGIPFVALTRHELYRSTPAGLCPRGGLADRLATLAQEARWRAASERAYGWAGRLARANRRRLAQMLGAA